MSFGSSSEKKILPSSLTLSRRGLDIELQALKTPPEVTGRGSGSQRSTSVYPWNRLFRPTDQRWRVSNLTKVTGNLSA